MLTRALAVVSIGLTTTLAHARARDVVRFDVDVGTRAVVEVTTPRLAEARLSAPRAAPSSVTITDDPGGNAIVTGPQGQFVIPLGKHDNNWMPWAFAQADSVVFAWREGASGTYRDVVHAVDVATHRELWHRVEPSGVGVVGEHLLAVGREGGVEIVDRRTGKVVRRLAIAGHGSLGTIAIGPRGDALVDTGDALARITAAGTLAWQVPKLGAAVAFVPLAEPDARYTLDTGRERSAPLPPTGDLVVLTQTHVARLDAATGKVRWSDPSKARSLLLDGARLFTAEVAASAASALSPTGTFDPPAVVRLVARALLTGRREAPDIEVDRRAEFFDQAEAKVVAVAGATVELTTTFIVLD